MSDLCELSAVGLHAMIGRRQISPVELLKSCFARIDRVNPALNAVVAEDRQAAMRAAEAAEAAVLKGEPIGALHGLPIGVKDLNETKGLRTTYGSPMFKDFVPQDDCTTVAAIRAAGGIITAKTNTPEFGAGANTDNSVYGFTGNPFDPNKTCAGSSGGSAVALATSMLPLCTGSDHGGSLRTPAAFCGVAGMRNTAGFVPTTNSRLAFSPQAVEGAMGRSVADLALLLSVLAGYDERDPLSRPANGVPLPLRPADLSTLRVAISEDLGFAPVDDTIRTIFRSRCDAFSGVFAETSRQDPDMGELDESFERWRALHMLAGFKEIYEKTPEKLGQNIQANVKLGLTYSAADIAWALAEQTATYRRFISFMENFDLLICPATSTTPFTREHRFPPQINGKPLRSYIHWVAITYGITMVNHPAIVLPCGLDHAGMPFGLQLVGRRGEDAGLLEIALALETYLAGLPECRRPMPSLERLKAA